MFQLQDHLDNHFRTTTHRYAFHATTPAELADWQQRFRAELSHLLGIADRPTPPAPSSQRLSIVDKGSYHEEKHALTVDDVQVPLYLLIPKAPPPHRLVMAFHGHGPGVNLILGNDPDAATHATNLALDENFAQRFAEDGYMVCAIEQRGFGERVTNQIDPTKSSISCRHLSFDYMLHGMNLMGERVRDGIAALNWVLNRPDMLSENIVCTGHSGGAATALFLSALDTRLTTVVISGYFCSYKHSILGMSHCECNYVPNLLTLGDIGELTALVAPRRLCLVNGRLDPIFPLPGINQPYEVVQRAYTVANAPDACSLVFHEGAHRYHYPSSLAWVQS
ncbi:MAG: alpha/beta hydrolase family protein [Anaerolineae bacterium]